MRRVDISKCKDETHRDYACGIKEIADGINGIMDYLEAVREGRPSWGPPVSEMMEEGFSEAEAIGMRKESERAVRKWDEIIHG